MIKTKKKKEELPKGATYNPELDKYANQELFKDKVDKANEIIKKAGVPNF